MADKRRILLAELQPKVPGAVTYGTWNPSDKSASITLSGGNLIATATPSGFGLARDTASVSYGQWYWETRVLALPTSGFGHSIGIATAAEPTTLAFLGFTANSAGWYSFDGKLYIAGVGSASTITLAVGDYLCHWLDLDARTYSIRKNGGAWITISIPAGVWFPAMTGSHNSSIQANFGASAFAFAVPDGVAAGIYSQAASATITLYVGSEGLCTTAAEAPASTAYLPRIAVDQDVETEREGSCFVWGGQTISRRGQLALVNADGGLDAWRNYEWRDAAVTLLSGYEGDARAAFTTWSIARVDKIEFTSAQRVLLTLADTLAALDCAMQPKLYPDTQANPQAAGKPLPIVLGRPMYCEPVLLDTTPLVRDYQVDDNYQYVFVTYDLASIDQIYDKGSLFHGPSDPFVAQNTITTATSGAAGGGSFATGWVADAGGVAMPFNWKRLGAFGGATDRFLEGATLGTLRMQSQGLLGRTPQIFHSTTSLLPGLRYQLNFTCTAITTAGTIEFALSQSPDKWVSVPVVLSSTGAKSVTIDPIEQAQLRIVLGASAIDATIDNFTATTVQIIDWTYLAPRTGFHLNNVPAGKVVCNPVLRNNSGTVIEYMSDVLAWFVNRARVQVGFVPAFDGADLAALTAAANPRVATYITQPKTFVTFLRELLDSWCGWVVPKRSGTLGLGRVAEPSQTSVLSLDTTNISGEIVASLDEAKGLTLRVGGRRNHAPHNPDGDFATSVGQDLRAELTSIFTVIRRGAQSVSGSPFSDAYRHAVGADPVATLLQDAGDIQTLANRLASLWKPTRYFYQVPCELGAAAADALEPGQTVTVTWPKLGLQNGRNLLVVGVKSRFFSRRVDLKLWG